MNKRILTIALLPLLSCGTAFAEEKTALDPANFSATLTFLTDYVFHGVSYSDEDPALQGSFDYGHPSGFYLGIWGSNWAGGDSSIEIDYYGGYAGASGDLGYGISGLYYSYPGADDDAAEWNYFEVNTTLSYTFSKVPLQPVIAGLLNYSPDYSAEDGDQYYTGATLGFSLPQGFGLDLAYGHTDIEGDKTTPGGFNWSHWSVGLSKELGGFGFDVTYHDTDEGDDGDLWGRIGAERVVASISRSF